MTSAPHDSALQPEAAQSPESSRAAKPAPRPLKKLQQVSRLSVDSIVVEGRLRDVTETVVDSLARDIERRGLRQPIEVVARLHAARDTKPIYRLVAGAHRLAAMTRLGYGEIPALVIGDEADFAEWQLRREEILENLARNELSKLERCRFLAELKRVYQEETGAQNGGDRRSARSFSSPRLADWYAEVAARSERAVRTIEREARIGERLTPTSYTRLVGTPFEDNQQDLELLAGLSPHSQARLLDAALDPAAPQPTLRAAEKKLNGRDAPAERDPLQSLKNAWKKADAAMRAAFMAWVEEQDEA